MTNGVRPRTAQVVPPVEGPPGTPRRKRPSRWHRPMWWINGIAVAVLLATYLAPHVSPRTFWWPALLAMAFPYQVMLHVAFIGWWLVFRRKRALLSLCALLIGYGHVRDHFQLFGSDTPPTADATDGFKLMSYNVRLFDLYNWADNKRSRDAIFEVFEREQPDILCLQEFFYSPHKRFFRTKETLMGDLRYKHVSERYVHRTRYDQHFGVATFSRFPIVDDGEVDFPDNPNNQCVWSDIVVRGDTIRVYNAHLASYHFGDADYKFIEGLDTGTKGDSLREGGVRILKRLRRGFNLRTDEVERIAAHMRACPYPVVYCGDMNDVPMGYCYARLRDMLDDSFVESGSGTGGTYIGALPSLRIDHILHGPELESWSFTTLPDKLSDHRAVTTMLGPVKADQ